MKRFVSKTINTDEELQNCSGFTHSSLLSVKKEGMEHHGDVF
jgi:hypothetical protein